MAPVLEKRLVPNDGNAEAAVEAVAPPRVKQEAAGGCGAVDVRTEPNVKPVPAVEEVVLVGREKGVAEAVGLLKLKLKPVGADVAAGAPEKKKIIGRKESQS